ACPHHGFSELHQLDRFYNALNINDQDSLNSAAGGKFLDKMPPDCLKIIESKSKVRQTRAKAVVAKVNSNSSTPTVSSDVAELKDMVRALLLDKKNQFSAQTSSPAPIKAVEPNCVTCGANYGQGNIGFRPQMVANQIRPPGFLPVNQPLAYQAPVSHTQSVSQNDFERYIKANDAVLRNIQNQGQSTQNQCQSTQNQLQTVQNQLANLTDMMSKFMSANTASSSGSGTLLGNTVTNPKEYLKGITTRSGVAYQGPTIPTPSKVAKQETEVTKDQVQTSNSQSIAPFQPTVTQSESETPVSEPVAAPISVRMPNLKSSIPYPLRRDNERRHDQANEQIKKFYEIFKEISFEISFTDALMLIPKFASTLKALIGNKEKLRMDECLALADLDPSINLMPLSMWKGLSLPGLTLTCMTLKLADRTESKPVSIATDVKVKVGMFHFPTDFVVVDFEPDPRVPLILGRNEAITYNLDQTSRYSANYDQMTVNKIDVTDEACEEYSQEVLGFSNVTASGSPTLYDDPIVSTTSPTLTPFGDSDFLLFEEADAFLELKACEAKTIKYSIDEPPERFKIRDELILDPRRHKKEVEKLLDAGLIYPISDSPWVSPVHCVPKKGGFTVVVNEENELILTRLVTGWRVCIDYRKLNEATRKDHFPLSFMDQMLERLAGNEYYCFLDGFSG
nr:reverse transcriptase domain-containing protein [Tanacetum cinerariifolium]